MLSQFPDGQRRGHKFEVSRFVITGPCSSQLAFVEGLGRAGRGKELVRKLAEACCSSRPWLQALHTRASQRVVCPVLQGRRLPSK